MKKILNHENVSFSKLKNSFEVKNPATNEIIAYVKYTNEDELKELIKKAEIAQKKWANKTAKERSDIMLKWHHLVVKNKKELAKIITLEQGKIINEALGEINSVASYIKWFGEEARRIDGDILTNNNSQRFFIIKQPIGVVAAITPWNFPAGMIARKAAPALAVGCAMIVKPATLTPLSAYAQANLAYEAGVPQDLFAIVCGDARKISDVFENSNAIRKISFTGSTQVGIEIYAKAAKSVKKVSLELGGNAPFIVFDDANLNKAIEGLMASKFRNSGQTCVCANRIYVQSKIYDQFCKELAKKVSNLKLGNGLDKGTHQGPLIDEDAVKKVEFYIKDALNNGAKCLTGGKRSALGKTFFEPTVLSDVKGDMLVAKQEIFGPLCPIFKFNEVEEVIKKANDTEFGLASYIFTDDFKKQWSVSEALEYGIVSVNTGIFSNEIAPFGGIKFSGIGREGSKYGADEYLEMKYICLDIT